MRNAIVAPMLAAVVALCAVLPARAGDPIRVCVAANGTMHVLAAASCGAGEEQKLFAEWEEEVDEPDSDDAAEKAAKLETQVRELTSRLAALESQQSQARARPEAQSGASRVEAPFEVVDASGSVILRVAESVSSSDGGGAQVTIGAGDGGNYAVRVHKDGGPVIAGIGQSTDGAGLAIVMDESGNIAANLNGMQRRVAVYNQGSAVAALVAEEQGGTVAVYNGQTPVAYLTRSSAGDGGNVTLSLNNGFGVFSAGAAQDGGGEACINRVAGGGQQRNACLGLELPSMGLGK